MQSQVIVPSHNEAFFSSPGSSAPCGPAPVSISSQSQMSTSVIVSPNFGEFCLMLRAALTVKKHHRKGCY